MFKTEFKRSKYGVEIKFVEETRSLFGMSRKLTPTDLREWSKASGASGALAYFELLRLKEAEPGLIAESDGVITIQHAMLAQLSNNTLAALNLPTNPEFQFSLQQRGSLASNDFQVVPIWQVEGRPILAKRFGAILRAEGQDWVIPNPIFTILERLEELRDDKKSNVQERVNLVADILSLINGTQTNESLNLEEDFSSIGVEESDSEKSNQLQVKLEGALSQFKVRMARALSVSVEFKSESGYKITPVLFERCPDSQNKTISEQDSLLNSEERVVFESHPSQGFFASASAKRTYLLASGEYILIDDTLFPAVDHIRSLEAAPPEEREEFARNPAKALVGLYREQIQSTSNEDLADDIQEEQLERLISSVFVETREYSDRVTGLGLWEPPVVPWIKKQPNSWEPEEFGIYLGNEFVTIPPKEIDNLRQEIERAIEAGQKTVKFDGRQIPATEAVKSVLSQLVSVVSPETPDGGANPPKQPGEHTVLLVKDNFEEEQYRRQVFPRERYTSQNRASQIMTSLMSHQETSMDWQVDAYLGGLPGILNADDQGLGKTLQTMSFLAWLQENMKAAPPLEKKPLLVVAPTTLLRNWSHEVETHMDGQFGLGTRIDAYGSGLKNLKRVAHDGSEYLDLGLEGLSNPNDKLIWVLTTYTTLAQNQVEFGKIDFGAVVFDEIQAIKNVTTLAHRAAQSLKADFQIGLTGTPVENSITELWAIMDTLAPGSFGSLKDFAGEYKDATEPKYRELNKQIFDVGYYKTQDDLAAPALGIRRMKSETVAELPLKNYRFYPEAMPTLQAQAYDMIFPKLRSETRGKALKVLHQLRTVSLYPGSLDQLDDDPDPLAVLAERSARIAQTLKILDSLSEKGEKVLLFLETHQMQHQLRRLLSRRYNLPDIPIINGQTTPSRRGEIVQQFQNTRGDGLFDIRILSPKSAGVGITMTAATHIIHLSRWWNPAIEEQCNDRIYRIGQDRDVTIHIPIAVHPHHQRASFDCILNDIMIRKRKLFRDILMPVEDFDADQSAMISGLTNENKFDISQIDSLDWKAFEVWTRNTAKSVGIWRVADTPATGDGGLDLHMEHIERGDVVLVQCKFTNQDERYLNEKPVHEVLHAATRYPTDKGSIGVVITNAEGFTTGARKLAEENGVILVDRHRLALWPNHIV